jgi:hypothetical protein
VFVRPIGRVFDIVYREITALLVFISF